MSLSKHEGVKPHLYCTAQTDDLMQLHMFVLVVCAELFATGHEHTQSE